MMVGIDATTSALTNGQTERNGASRGPVRIGEAAFGGCRGDGPGITREITADALPTPDSDIVLAEAGAGRIRLLRTAYGLAAPIPTITFASDLTPPFSIAFWSSGVLIEGHSASLGVAFYDGTEFPPDDRDDAFIALHGSRNRAQRRGCEVVRLRFPDGHPTVVFQDFTTGLVGFGQAVWRRPVGLTVIHDGSLLVSEDGIAYRAAP
ncbi:hypothetical protein [Rhodopila sp.]|uniref:hypothetical protein n=1 Tax=Rhodopila sp. TaxID=2480087 RepID=UPI003D0E9506